MTCPLSAIGKGILGNYPKAEHFFLSSFQPLYFLSSNHLNLENWAIDWINFNFHNTKTSYKAPKWGVGGPKLFIWWKVHFSSWFGKQEAHIICPGADMKTSHILMWPLNLLAWQTIAEAYRGATDPRVRSHNQEENWISIVPSVRTNHTIKKVSRDTDVSWKKRIWRCLESHVDFYYPLVSFSRSVMVVI